MGANLAEFDKSELLRFLKNSTVNEWNDAVLATRTREPHWVADLSLTRLDGLDLWGKNLSVADFRFADMKRVDLRGTNLESANLTGVSFMNSTIWKAKLCGARIDGAPGDVYTLSGKCKPVGFIDNLVVLAFSVNEDPGHVFLHKASLIQLPDLESHANMWGENPEISGLLRDQAKSIVSTWSNDTVHNPKPPTIATESPASYLAAEAERTGQSPADIILGD